MFLLYSIENHFKIIAILAVVLVLFTSCSNSEAGEENVPVIPVQHEVIEKNNKPVNNEFPKEVEIIFPEDSVNFIVPDTLNPDTTQTATQPEVESSTKRPSFKSFYRYMKMHKKSPVAMLKEDDMLMVG